MDDLASGARRATQPQQTLVHLPADLVPDDWLPQPAVHTPQWRVVAGAAAGSKRRASAQSVPPIGSRPDAPGDDRWRLEAQRIGLTPVLLVAVADGAGSAAAGGLGAEVATAHAIRHTAKVMAQRSRRRLRRCPSQQDGRQLVQAVQTALALAAEQHGLAVRELACTLLLAVLTARFTWIVQVGDGAVVGQLPEGGAAHLACWPQQGEYANQTCFVTEPGVRPVVVRWPAVRALAVFTDGLQHLALHNATRRAHTGFFTPLWQAVADHPPGQLAEQLSAWLASPAIAERTDDDATLVLALREPDRERQP